MDETGALGETPLLAVETDAFAVLFTFFEDSNRVSR